MAKFASNTNVISVMTEEKLCLGFAAAKCFGKGMLLNGSNLNGVFNYMDCKIEDLQKLVAQVAATNPIRIENNEETGLTQYFFNDVLFGSHVDNVNTYSAALNPNGTWNLIENGTAIFTTPLITVAESEDGLTHSILVDSVVVGTFTDNDTVSSEHPNYTFTENAAGDLIVMRDGVTIATITDSDTVSTPHPVITFAPNAANGTDVLVDGVVSYTIPDNDTVSSEHPVLTGVNNPDGTTSFFLDGTLVVTDTPHTVDTNTQFIIDLESPTSTTFNPITRETVICYPVVNAATGAASGLPDKCITLPAPTPLDIDRDLYYRPVGAPEGDASVVALSVSALDSDASSTGEVTNFHTRAVAASTNSLASGLNSFVYGAINSQALEELSSVGGVGVVDAKASHILGGFTATHAIDGPFTDYRNEIKAGTFLSSIIGGGDNLIDSSGALNHIFGAAHSDVTDSANHVIITGGSQHSISLATNYSGIFAGQQNSIALATGGLSTVIGGTLNTIGGGGSASIVAGGSRNMANGGTSAIVGSNDSETIGGRISGIYTSEFSKIGDGDGATPNITVIVGARDSSANDSFTGIYTGRDHVIGAGTDNSVITGGQNNEIGNSASAAFWSIIAGGQNNTIADSGNSFRSGIFAGSGNTVNAGGAAVLAGLSNTIAAGATNSVILGGSGITATAANTAYISRLVLTNLPTAPGAAGSVWNNGGVLNIS